jgi:polar amino acid transport system substrate-binding protein
MGTVGQPSLLLLEEESKKCTAAGKPAIDVQAGPGTSARLAALKSGRTDAIPTDGAVAAYLSSRNSDIYEPAGPVIGKHLLGIVFKKGDTALQTAVQAALRQVKADGRYDQILAKWGVADGGLKDFTINGANSE